MLNVVNMTPAQMYEEGWISLSDLRDLENPNDSYRTEYEREINGTTFHFTVTPKRRGPAGMQVATGYRVKVQLNGQEIYNLVYEGPHFYRTNTVDLTAERIERRQELGYNF